MKPFNFIILPSIVFLLSCAKDKAEQKIPTPTFHEIQVLSNQFTPDSININLGDTVRWTNNSGFHNINGTSIDYPNNPEEFGNNVGSSWVYSHVFSISGTYDYRCDPHFSMGMSGVVVVQ